MPAWLLPLAISSIAAGASYFGARSQNRAQKEEAEKNRQFQERMSSTSAQRSVEDYRRAGLNPALAYDRSASSPGGAQANIGNEIEGAISNAKQAAGLHQELKQSREMHTQNLRLAEASIMKTKEERNKLEADKTLSYDQSNLARQQWLFNQIDQPSTTRMKSAEAILRELLIPGAQNTATFENTVGAAGKGLASARTLAEIIKMLNPRDFRK